MKYKFQNNRLICFEKLTVVQVTLWLACIYLLKNACTFIMFTINTRLCLRTKTYAS